MSLSPNGLAATDCTFQSGRRPVTHTMRAMNRLLSALVSDCRNLADLSSVRIRRSMSPPIRWPCASWRMCVAEDSTIVVEARYSTANNFTGAVLPGYEANKAYLRKEAAEALHRVQQRLRSGGMGLKIFDGYRPVRATQAMVDWARRTGQMHLIQDGYIASRSRHNLGLAVDLTLVDFSVGGREVDMGTPFDTFSRTGALGQCAGHARCVTGSCCVR